MNAKMIELKRYFLHIQKNGMRVADFNVFNFILYGLLFDVIFNMYRPFLPTYIKRVGGGELYISLLNSIPGFVAIFTVLPGAILVSKFANKKRVTAILFGISRSFLLALALVPFMPEESRPLMIVVLLGLMNFPDAVSQTSLQNYLGTLFNPHSRSTAIALRNKYGNMAAAAVVIITGLIMSFAVKDESKKLFIYQIFFIVAFLFAILEITIFSRFKEPKNVVQESEKPNIQIKSTFKAIMKDKKFGTFLAATLFFYFSWHMGWPIGTVMQVQRLQASEAWIAICLISGVLGLISFSSFWGKKINKIGNNTVLAICSTGMGLNALAVVIVPNLPLYALTSFMANAFGAGINIALLNGLLEATPTETRVVYIGFYNTFVNVSLAVAPMVSLLIANASSYFTAGIITFSLRLIAALVFLVLAFGKKRAEKY